MSKASFPAGLVPPNILGLQSGAVINKITEGTGACRYHYHGTPYCCVIGAMLPRSVGPERNHKSLSVLTNHQIGIARNKRWSEHQLERLQECHDQLVRAKLDRYRNPISTRDEGLDREIRKSQRSLRKALTSGSLKGLFSIPRFYSSIDASVGCDRYQVPKGTKVPQTLEQAAKYEDKECPL